MGESFILDGLSEMAVPIGDVVPMAGNPRRGDVESVAKSLARFGQHRPIVAQRSTREIIAGNHTYLAAKSLGWDQVAVLWTDDDRETALARSLADNRTHEDGGYDNAELAAMMAEVASVDDTMLASAGFGSDEIDALLALATPVEELNTLQSEPFEVVQEESKPDQAVTVERVESSGKRAATETVVEYDGDPGEAQLFVGDCLDALAEFPDNTFHACITDPLGGVAPKGVRTSDTGFGENEWNGVPGVAFWQEIARVMRPGGWVVVLAATKSWHRLAVAAEQAGLEMRDTLMWLYTTGMTDGLDIGQAVDRKQGGKGAPYFRKAGSMTDEQRGEWLAAREESNPWYGWSTALKPAWKPILLMRKPPKQAAAASAMEWGTSVLNIDDTRIESGERDAVASWKGKPQGDEHGGALSRNRVVTGKTTLGRWPSNVVIDEDVAAELGETARFFVCSAASGRERNDGLPSGVTNDHPVVRPVDLMRWLARLVCPNEGVILDPFCGTGTTGVAAVEEGFGFVGIDRNERWITEIAEHRIREARLRQAKKTRGKR